jgi:ribosomal subunit interface protein
MREMPHSDALETRIREHAAKLEQFHPRIGSCRVAVEQTHRHHRQGREFTVRINLRVPGDEIVVSRNHHEDVYVALRDAFDAAKRRLEEVMREQRGDIKGHPVPLHGKVARIVPDEGYGFIETADGRELYFSRDNVVYPSFENLEPGVAVQFVEEPAAEGPQAKRVSAGRHGA